MKKAPKKWMVNIDLKYSYDFIVKARSEAEASRIAVAKFNQRILPMKDLQVSTKEFFEY